MSRKNQNRAVGDSFECMAEPLPPICELFRRRIAADIDPHNRTRAVRPFAVGDRIWIKRADWAVFPFPVLVD